MPEGATDTGAEGGVGPAAETLIVLPALHALDPTELIAITNQLYVAPLVSGVDGVTEQVPLPHPRSEAAYTDATATPDVFCTTR